MLKPFVSTWYFALYPAHLTLTAIPRGFEAEVFTGWLPFLSPNQQCQCTEGSDSDNDIYSGYSIVAISRLVINHAAYYVLQECIIIWVLS